MYNIGSIPAVFVTGPVNDLFGRRMGMFVGAVVIIIGTCGMYLLLLECFFLLLECFFLLLKCCGMPKLLAVGASAYGVYSNMIKLTLLPPI